MPALFKMLGAMPAEPANGNFRVQSGNLFELLDISAGTAYGFRHWYPIYALVLPNATVVPVLPSSVGGVQLGPDVTTLAGDGYMPIYQTNGNYRWATPNFEITDGNGNWYQPYIELTGPGSNIPTVVLTQTTDSTSVAVSYAYVPASTANSNFRLYQNTYFQIYCPANGLWYTIFVTTGAGGKKVISCADTGVA